MPQSLAQILVHIVFSTKDRSPLIEEPHLTKLHAYLAAIVRDQKGLCHGVGGVADHVHVAITMPRTQSIATMIEHLKTNSSKWMKQQSPKLNGFAWQRGYGAFSFSTEDLTNVQKYISYQHEHHREVTFQDEFRALLTRFRVSYDEQYVWD